MNRLALTLLLASLSVLHSIGAHAYLGHLGLVDLNTNVFRPGWPPYFPAQVEDFGLRGNVKCVVMREVKEQHPNSETLCFDKTGRISSAETDRYDLQVRIGYEYDGKRMKRAFRHYSNGEEVEFEFHYDSKGQMYRAIKTNSTDIDKFIRYRKEKFPDFHKTRVSGDLHT